jgi:hypothetical protein
MRNVRLVLLLALVVFTLGCGGGRKLAGTWSASGMSGLPPGASADLTFTEPDKMVMKIVSSNDAGGQKMTMTITINGTYKLSGNTIEMKATGVDIQTSGVPDAQKAMMDSMMEPIKKQMMDQMNKESAQTIEWKSNNEFIAKTKDGKDTTFTRK